MNANAAAIDADLIEIAAMGEIVAAAPASVVEATGLLWLEVADTSAVLAPQIADPLFNRVMGLGLQQVASREDLESIIAACRAATDKSYWIHRHPLSQPAELDDWLMAQGFALAKRRSWAKVARGRDAPPQFATSLGIRVACATDFAAAADVARTAFGMPPAMTPWLAAIYSRPDWYLVVAEEHGRIVGSGALYVKDGIGWLGIGGVLPEFRGRNAHRCLMALRIQLALDLGCRLIVTETGEPVGDEPNPSLANMYRCGFQMVASRLNYQVFTSTPLATSS